MKLNDDEKVFLFIVVLVLLLGTIAAIQVYVTN